MKTENFIKKAKTGIKNALECIDKQPMTVFTADDIYKAAEELFEKLRADFIANPDDEKKEALAYVRDFMWAAEKLDDAMLAFLELERDFIED